MTKGLSLTCILLLLMTAVRAQETIRDTTLQEVVVQAYTADRAPQDVPASIGYLSQPELSRYNNASLLPAVNSIPGVRMEERSPGSYRFSVRGSSIRSPFGVRNIKAYWNGLPFTDAGGNTYLNLIDLNQVGSIEIVKGPGGSLYGAGTGGTILLNKPLIRKNLLSAAASAGSYGLQRYALGGSWYNNTVQGSAFVTHQRSEGYREQSAMERTASNVEFGLEAGSKSFLSATIFYTDLFYETPGGLNESQFKDDPSRARPATATIPGAVEQNAAVYNKTFYGGISLDHQWNENLNTTTGVYGSHIDFKNPSIRNYEVRSEPNVGARSVTKYTSIRQKTKNYFTAGGEFQYLNASISVYDNDLGVKSADASSDDQLKSALFLLFAQNDLELNDKLNITVGLSANFVNVDFQQSIPTNLSENRNFDVVLLPRIAGLYKLSPFVSVYGSFSQGFSPPTIAELFPSRGIFDKNLNPERGDNYEVGVKGNALKKRFVYELAAYNFQLKETIVIRRDASLPGEPEYFVNAGKTSQNGLEAQLTFHIWKERQRFFSDLKIYGSYTYNHYRFRNYFQEDDNFSGNKLTGVPPTVLFTGVDLLILRRFYLNVTSNYVDHIPLNDSNNDFSKEYFVLGARVGYTRQVLEHRLEIFGGIDNALDKTYSLGHDLNGFGGRYYNAAPLRNYYFGIKFDLFM